MSYVPSANKVVVPEYLLRPPLFHPAAPYSVNLGGLGVMIAEAVVEGVLGAGSVFTASGGPSILKSSLLSAVISQRIYLHTVSSSTFLLDITKHGCQVGSWRAGTPATTR